MAHDTESTAPADREILAGIFNAALAAVDPYNAVLKAASVVHDHLHVAGATYDLATFERIIVVGAGKATARMALAVESLLGNRISAGLIVVKEEHTVPLKIIGQVEASHPVPNEAGIAGAQRILDMVRAAEEKTLVICLLSGGASALLVAPVDGDKPGGVTLQDKQEATKLLLNAGASINELNAVRKHLSAVKGGRLAQAAYPAQLVTLIISDVIGDALDVIGSGPTSPDNSTFADAWAVIEKFGLQEKLPPRVADYLQRGIAGQIPETVKANDPCLNKAHNVIIAGIGQALDAAKEMAARLGFSEKTLSDTLQGAGPRGGTFSGTSRARRTGRNASEPAALPALRRRDHRRGARQRQGRQESGVRTGVCIGDRRLARRGDAVRGHRRQRRPHRCRRRQWSMAIRHRRQGNWG